MATRSTIGKLNPDGTVTKIYCHWDGYIEGNGEILYQHYTTEEKIDSLLALGSLSFLDIEVNPTQGHSFDIPQPGVCVAYGRDRGETNVGAIILESEESFYSNGEEYDYLWKNGEWYVDGKNLEEIIDPKKYQNKIRFKKLDRIIPDEV